MEMRILAQQLGISHQMTNRYKAKGMPTDSLESALTWRKKNIDPFRSKAGRIGGGNTGIRRGAANKTKTIKPAKEHPNLDSDTVNHALTHIVPNIWFAQIGRLGRALLEHGVNVPSDDLVKVQSTLFLMYMIDIDDYLEIEAKYQLPFTLLQPGDEAYPSLVESLNKILGYSNAPG